METVEKCLFFLHPASRLSWELVDIEEISEERLDTLFDEYRILASFGIDDRICLILYEIILDMCSRLSG
jgi:hypothetical protein